jgi:hypothetical protein
MVKILAIGNSFSQNATTLLHDMAKQSGIDTKVVNLYIGGCSLKTHWENAEHDYPNYDYQLNGKTGIKTVSIKDALLEEEWDYITMQQFSGESGLVESYFPYITKLSLYVSKYAPSAKQIIHQTWAYEIDSNHGAFTNYKNDQILMYKSLKAAYQKVAEAINAEIIPCGDVIQELRKLNEFNYANGGKSLCCDGFHMHPVYGNYATAATWCKSLLKIDITSNTYLPPCCCLKDDIELINVIKNTVHKICSKPLA